PTYGDAVSQAGNGSHHTHRLTTSQLKAATATPTTIPDGWIGKIPRISWLLTRRRSKTSSNRNWLVPSNRQSPRSEPVRSTTGRKQPSASVVWTGGLRRRSSTKIGKTVPSSTYWAHS